MNPSNNNELNPNSNEAQEVSEEQVKKFLATLQAKIELKALKEGSKETDKKTLFKKYINKLSNEELIDIAKSINIDISKYDFQKKIHRIIVEEKTLNALLRADTERIEAEIAQTKAEIAQTKAETAKIKADTEKTEGEIIEIGKGMQKNLKEMGQNIQK